MPDAPTIQLPSVKALWKIRMVDDVMNPKGYSSMMLRKCVSAGDVLRKLEEVPGYQEFKKTFPKAEVVLIEFMGFTEN
jgi:hypothetical protein